MARDGFAGVSRAGFVSTRIAGTNGVSLETKKRLEILRRMGIACHYIAGEADGLKERCTLIEEARFAHEAIQEINRRAFGVEQRDLGLTSDVLQLTLVLRDRLHATIDFSLGTGTVSGKCGG